MTSSSVIQWKRPTPNETIGILANPFTYGFAAMVLTVWAGGKVCDHFWPPVRGAR